MAKAPAFQFYPKDWLTDAKVKAMSLEAKGAYIDLLGFYWLEEGLPANSDSLARLIGIAPAKFRRIWPQIEPCFRIEGERLIQKRMEHERTQQDKFREERSKAGSYGAEVKKQKASSAKAQLQNSASSASALPQAKSSSSVSVLPSAVSVLPSAVRTNGRGDGPPANPLIGPGERPKLETECLSLVRRLSALTGEDGVDVMARASGYEGAKTTKLNPASMSDDRLLNTIRDLRADVAAEEKRRGATKSAGA